MINFINDNNFRIEKINDNLYNIITNNNITFSHNSLTNFDTSIQISCDNSEKILVKGYEVENELYISPVSGKEIHYVPTIINYTNEDISFSSGENIFKVSLSEDDGMSDYDMSGKNKVYDYNGIEIFYDDDGYRVDNVTVITEENNRQTIEIKTIKGE